MDYPLVKFKTVTVHHIMINLNISIHLHFGFLNLTVFECTLPECKKWLSNRHWIQWEALYHFLLFYLVTGPLVREISDKGIVLYCLEMIELYWANELKKWTSRAVTRSIFELFLAIEIPDWISKKMRYWKTIYSKSIKHSILFINAEYLFRFSWFQISKWWK